jgi:MFS family permease
VELCSKQTALLLLCVAQFMVILDVSIVNVAVPSIRRDLHVSDTDLQWVVNAYALAFGGSLLLGGRAADLLGRRRVFIFGLALFSAASLVGGLSRGIGMLTAARALQGLGAAIVSPATLAILTTTFTEPNERRRAMGLWAAVAGAGGAVGVLLPGVLTDAFSWPWVLLVNVPIGVAVIVVSRRAIRSEPPLERVATFLQTTIGGEQASFVGVERVTGSVAGRSGTFVLQDQGTVNDAVVSGAWFVVPRSGTGEPEGLRGEGGFRAALGQGADITLDYWFEWAQRVRTRSRS